jgi:hypothetical protein
MDLPRFFTLLPIVSFMVLKQTWFSREGLPSVVLMASAGGLGWGIRGQYGHETGAMIAGVLMGWVVALFYLRLADSLYAFRVVSMLALGVSIGGSMTYGQTIGLTQNGELIGHWDALAWGMVGLAIKGGLWFGFAGLFLAIGLSATAPRPGQIILLFVVGLIAFPAGLWLLNSPFDRSGAPLPWLYFSESPAWYPSKAQFNARPECWGGLLVSLVAMTSYAARLMRNKLAWRLTGWGLLAGALGFPGGQCIQAYHAWNATAFVESPWWTWFQHVNWWNMMEISFGTIAGGVLGLGLWLHRHRVLSEVELRALGQDQAQKKTENLHQPDCSMPMPLEVLLIAGHIAMLLGSGFANQPALDWYQEYGLVLAFLPVLGVASGRIWPYWFPTCIVLLPIVGKTIRHVAYEQTFLSVWQAWCMAAVVMLAMAALSIFAQRSIDEKNNTLRLSAISLGVTTMVYLVVNFAVFNFAWPWEVWTSRTPSAIVMFAQGSLLFLGAALGWRIWRR